MQVMSLFLCYLRDEPRDITEKCLEAKRMLETWKASYFSTRAKIEESGRDSRWEFDRKRLFERTDYMAKICDDLANMAKVCFLVFDYFVFIFSSSNNIKSNNIGRD